MEKTAVTIELNIATLIYIASCVTVIGGALGVLAKAKNALVSPLNEINQKLAEHEEYLSNDKQHFDKIDYILEDLIRSNNMLIKSHRTVLHHLEEGNHSGEIKSDIKQIDDWLIERKETQWKIEH